MGLNELVELFIREKKYLKGVSDATLSFYRDCFKAWRDVVGDSLPDKINVNEFVIRLRERGTSPSSVDAYSRGFNSFLSWLHENGGEKLRIKRQKLEQRVLKPLTEEELKKIVSYKPQTATERRTHTLVLLALDTGCRIKELLTLTRENVDLDNLLIAVKGKGNKERVVPVSIEMRKFLYRHLRTHKHSLVFCTRHGGRIHYDNCRRDFNNLLGRAGVGKTDGAFHSLRRTFARQYVRNGGNLFYLQKMLGHTTLTMSRRYVELETEDLQVMHAKTSLISKLRQ